jgi:HSP20 family protein
MNGLMRWQRPEMTTWPTFERLTDLREELDRLFGMPLASWPQSSQLLSGWTPAMDLFEDKDNLYLKAELPGMKKEEIEVSLHEGVLTLSGERKQESKHGEGEAYRSERFFGRFQRSISLPVSVAADKVKAQYQEGILTITLPKAEEAKPKRINVNFN